MGFFWSGEEAKRVIRPVLPDRGFELSVSGFVNTLRKIVLSFVAWAILSVLLVRGYAQIVPPVVSGIEVPVIDGASIRNIDSHQDKDHLVNVEPLLGSVQSEGDDIISRSTIGTEAGRTSGLTGVVVVMPLPFQFSLEMFSWPFCPEQHSGFGIVGKGLAEASLEGYQFGSRAFGLHRFSDVSVRRMGADTPIAPPVYPTLTTEATA